MQRQKRTEKEECAVVAVAAFLFRIATLTPNGQGSTVAATHYTKKRAETDGLLFRTAPAPNSICTASSSEHAAKCGKTSVTPACTKRFRYFSLRVLEDNQRHQSLVRGDRQNAPAAATTTRIDIPSAAAQIARDVAETDCRPTESHGHRAHRCAIGRARLEHSST